MCGILGLVRVREQGATTTLALVESTQIVRHRGPDDEGYLLWSRGGAPRVYAGSDTASQSRLAHHLGAIPPNAAWDVALGHRRLSIVDLSPGGYQPMVHAATGIAVAFNGEIYNHIELRQELSSLGHRFRSQSDTEVLLAAWMQWGEDSLHRLNGMFAFILIDPRDETVHAVRDRFGVKPLYWTRTGDVLAFASEIKQLRSLPGFEMALDVSAAREYLSSGRTDQDERTLESSVHQLVGGERAVVRLSGATADVTRERWYTLRPSQFAGSIADAGNQVRELLEDSVRLRLRADVSVGSCLSGGLDSSAIVCLVQRQLDAQRATAGQLTVTARFRDIRYDEWSFARQVIERTRAQPIEVWPSVEKLLADFDRHLWYMDLPFGSTSQFSQWCVFEAAANAGLKVMLDGQGSDEQLAGYTGSESALYAGLMARGAAFRLTREALAFRRRHGYLPVGQLLTAFRAVAPAANRVLPERLRPSIELRAWLRGTGDCLRPPHGSLSEQLSEQLLSTSLPALLRYEDRNSMARSIEARVPFLDVRLVEFLAGLPDRMKFRDGVTKVVLREAMTDVIPSDIVRRRDKMGFVTPEQTWLTNSARPWILKGVSLAAEAVPDLIDADHAVRFTDDVLSCRAPFSFELWRLACFGRWMQTRLAPADLSPVHAPALNGQ